ncbi:GNAT family N-acetyltransferase [Actinotalea sp. K2]|uniref:GNAT family N-acetyltransferase n=1 Tax=Actinotalea sp. K2 TaxID=2939438 RepID=UPI002017C064|nr:GNAT family protein [Actinotalea sp. K2]MCL3863149.1 GNAT family N-acetyltransferase [Actinotalea sp. K2]
MDHDLRLATHGVALVPLGHEHAEALLGLIDEPLWAGMTTPVPRGVADLTAWVDAALATPGRYAFAVVDEASGEVRGSTSFYDVDRTVRRLEIGHTFYGRGWWGGRTNPACKLALLTHAFDGWDMHRVALRADARNARSVAAMRRLGAVAEGVLRGHRLAADGSRGDTAYFSILAPEWPDVRAGLLARLTTAPDRPSTT